MKLSENMRVGKWTLLHPASETRWTCRCECGMVKQVLAYNLEHTKTKSCGCARTVAHRRAMVDLNRQGAAWQQ
jgi:hypothetical protein